MMNWMKKAMALAGLLLVFGFAAPQLALADEVQPAVTTLAELVANQEARGPVTILARAEGAAAADGPAKTEKCRPAHLRLCHDKCNGDYGNLCAPGQICNNNKGVCEKTGP